MKQFAGELGINVWLRQGGYLFLARSAEIAERLERERRAAQQARRADPDAVTPDAARDIVPELHDEGRGARAPTTPTTASSFPGRSCGATRRAAQKRGVQVETFTTVTGFEISGGRVRAVKTDRGDIACETVVLAAGAWSPEVAKLAGVKLPNEPHRHEILCTEPLKPFLGPLVSVLDSGLYFSQSMRGEIVGGMGDPREPAGLNMGSTLRFLARFSRALTRADAPPRRRQGAAPVGRPLRRDARQQPDPRRTPGLPNCSRCPASWATAS